MSRSPSLADAVRDVIAADAASVVLGDATLPVADRGTFGYALGLALAGKRPVVELSGTSRLPAVLEVLAEAGAIAARGEFAVPLLVRVPYGVEAVGLDLPVGRFLLDLPGVTVVCASSPASAAGLTRWALGQRGPVVLLEPRAIAGQRGPLAGVDGSASGPAARVVRSGAHVVLASFGAGVAAALAAADQLARDGVEAGVVDLVSLSPLDAATLGAEVRRAGRLVVVHDGEDALARRVHEVALAEAFLWLEAPLAASSPGEATKTALDAVRY